MADKQPTTIKVIDDLALMQRVLTELARLPIQSEIRQMKYEPSADMLDQLIIRARDLTGVSFKG